MNYELIDFGGGRKLEKFDSVLVDRPAPAAGDAAKAHPAQWAQAHLRYDRSDAERGQWSDFTEPENWHFSNQWFRLNLQCSPAGQVGVFPEQQKCWNWLRESVEWLRPESRAVLSESTPVRILNLFAYTGGSSLVCAKSWTDVTHVDASRTSVTRAKGNATSSGLKDHVIRWIVEDVPKYVARAARRGQTYHGIVLDPPSYGHGPKGEAWIIERDLDDLLQGCMRLLNPEKGFMLITDHTEMITHEFLPAMIEKRLERSKTQLERHSLDLETADGRTLPSGKALRLRYDRSSLGGGLKFEQNE